MTAKVSGTKFEIQKTNVSRTQFEKDLCKKRNMKQLGEGAFATVYGNRARAVKIGRADEYGNERYLQYLSRASKYPKNPFFPKIFSIKVYRKGTDSPYMVVEMERLQRPKSAWTTASIMESFICDNDAVKVMEGMFTKRASKQLLEVNSVLKKHRYDLDIHDDNIMVRKNGQLVITDPVA